MNIFVTSPDPTACAQALADPHVRKMLMESAQMLSTAILHHRPDLSGVNGLCKPTHRHHPIVLWAGSSRDAAYWLFAHAAALAAEYQHRRGKTHATAARLPTIAAHLDVIPDGPMPPFHADVPADLRALPVFDAYRALLPRKYAAWTAARAAGNKRKPAPIWTNRQPPAWLQETP